MLSASVLKVACSVANDTGNIKGGNPGTDESTIVFKGCVVEKLNGEPIAESECNVKGSIDTEANTITVKVKTELVYLGNEEEAKKEEGPVGDLFSPASGGTFVTLDFAGTNCPAGTTGAYAVTGSVVGNVSPEPEIYSHHNRIIFPATPIAKSYKWESAGKVKEAKDKLTVFSAKATQEGEEEVEIEDKTCVEHGSSETGCEFAEGGVTYYHLLSWGVLRK